MAIPSGSRWRAAARIAELIALLLVMAPLHIVTKWVRGHSNWPPRFLGAAAWIAGMRVTVVGEPLTPRTLVLANHTSWLDILILGGATGTAFVSKADIEKAPLVGWLADQNHTLYIERAARGDALGQVRRIAEGIERAQPLTVFPEGTTSDGRALLPFRSTLLAAVAPPPPGAQVRPIAIDYGEAAEVVAWVGEPALTNALRLLGRRGTAQVTVRLLESLDPQHDRKVLAKMARDAIGAALAANPR